MEDNGEKLTSSVSFLMNYIKQSMDTFDQVYFSVSMEAIEGATGVSSPLPPGEGILAEDVVKMFHLLGKNCTNLVAVEVSDYNPFIED
jgi:arginase family enzyme